MKKLILPMYLLIVLSLMLGYFILEVEPEAVAYENIQGLQVEYITKINWTAERIEQEIEEQAKAYGVKASVMKAVIDCESLGSTTIQSYHKLHYGREQSYGLAQIHLPHHKDITKEQAQDPEFAIEFMAQEMSEGRAWKWTCWRNIYGKS